MNFLAFDTTHAFLTACAELDGKSAIHEDQTALRHSVTLMPAIDRLLGDKKPDAIGVCIGPGSFTGIRIGVTTAKTLAWAWNVPIVPFTSVELLGVRETDAVVVVDGGNRVWYVGVISGGKLYGDIMQKNESELTSYLSDLPSETTVVGYDCAGRTAKKADRGADKIAELVKKKLARRETTDYAHAEPLYVQLSQAERS